MNCQNRRSRAIVASAAQRDGRAAPRGSAGTAMQAKNSTSDATSTSASTVLLPWPAAVRDKATPLAIAARIKLTEPHTLTRP
ncbi:MAG TPA: hypothetical protein VNV38_13845 [Stellaceae bacterium]|jgi:hypothetical protein|nr:hypothetical protein [Stellaceae bacterium]